MNSLAFKLEFPSTHHSLLARVCKGNDNQAWSEFVERYGLIVLRWCCKRLGNTDFAKEVALDLLVDLPSKLRNFENNPEAGRFRGWLKIVVKNACTDLLRRRQRERHMLACLVQSDSLDELTRQLNRVLDQDLYDVACVNVQKRLENHSQGKIETWEAYRLTVSPDFFGGEGLTNEEAAQRLGVDIEFVEKSRSNIKRMLAEEIRRLEASELP